ncbi:hypothetical protein AAFF_G00417290 [Aldrovandia affinis]|uniref:Uncharacterized protein n=1 Tax=Aldrovandia affinis TaxID=143900 RepID=A0AAD7R3W1_9TELE|nr:hypothetical protein AAFF_G00417290 [Aldrovandia affinis]
MFRACPDRKHSYAELFRVGSSSADGDGAAEVAAQAASSRELMDSEPSGAWADVEDEYVMPPEHVGESRKRGSSPGESWPSPRKKPPPGQVKLGNRYDALAVESEMDSETETETETVSRDSDK